MELEMLKGITVPFIAGAVYGIIQVIKSLSKDNKKIKDFIPVMALGIGSLLGILCFVTVPEITLSSTAYAAAIVGAASGLSATGTNQIIKCLIKPDCKDPSG